MKRACHKYAIVVGILALVGLADVPPALANTVWPFLLFYNFNELSGLAIVVSIVIEALAIRQFAAFSFAKSLVASSIVNLASTVASIILAIWIGAQGKLLQIPLVDWLHPTAQNHILGHILPPYYYPASSCIEIIPLTDPRVLLIAVPYLLIYAAGTACIQSLALLFFFSFKVNRKAAWWLYGVNIVTLSIALSVAKYTESWPAITFFH